MLIDLVESREIGYISCKQNHNATRYPYEHLFSLAREYTFSSKQYQKAKANAISSSGISLRLCNAICFVTFVVDPVLLSASGLGGEVGLGREEAAIRSLLAATGIWQVLGHVIGSSKGFGSRLTSRTGTAGTG